VCVRACDNIEKTELDVDFDREQLN